MTEKRFNELKDRLTREYVRGDVVICSPNNYYNQTQAMLSMQDLDVLAKNNLKIFTVSGKKYSWGRFGRQQTYYVLRSVDDDTIIEFPTEYFAMNFVLLPSNGDEHHQGKQKFDAVEYIERAAANAGDKKEEQESTEKKDKPRWNLDSIDSWSYYLKPSDLSSDSTDKRDAVKEETPQKEATQDAQESAEKSLDEESADSTGDQKTIVKVKVPYTSNWYDDKDIDVVVERIRSVAQEEGLETALYRALYSPQFLAHDEKAAPKMRALSDTKNHTRRKVWTVWQEVPSAMLFKGLELSPWHLSRFHFYFKENGKSVVARISFEDDTYILRPNKYKRIFKAKATCNTDDDFDLEKGKMIAFRRATIKMLEYLDKEYDMEEKLG